MQNQRPLRIHWCASPCHTRFIEWCCQAESFGIESVSIPLFDFHGAPNLAALEGSGTGHLQFRINWVSGPGSPSDLGLLKDLWGFLGGRLIVHTYFALDCDVLRAGEFITSCRQYFSSGDAPKFDVEGESAEAAFLTIKQADCLWRRPHRPAQVYADALPVLYFGKEVGMVSLVLARETREEALAFAASLLPANNLEQPANRSRWITACLWVGAVAGLGEQAALVGSFEEVADAIYGFKRSGISQFLVRECPGQNEMAAFATGVLPRIRARECSRMAD
jgi:hypothetical protein